MIGGRYIVGKILGEGGFGITYIGYDTKHNQKVAVKEYYPADYVTRTHVNNNGKIISTVTPKNTDKEQFFKYGKEKFLGEASTLARFTILPGIVSVNNLFKENGTAYIVMEYIEGKTLKSILKEKSRLPESYVLQLMKPVLESLSVVHRAGLMHRDIAPDNILVRPDNTAKLIDFGSAAEAAPGEYKPTVAMVKMNFAPEEQFDGNRQRQGSWTDVYALCATIYMAIEGRLVPRADERLRQDSPITFTAPVSRTTSSAIIQGLALYAKNRIQTVDELYRRIYGENIPQNPTAPVTTQQTAYQPTGNIQNSTTPLQTVYQPTGNTQNSTTPLQTVYQPTGNTQNSNALQTLLLLSIVLLVLCPPGAVYGFMKYNELIKLPPEQARQQAEQVTRNCTIILIIASVVDFFIVYMLLFGA
jgi:serine/threonine protein kinase